MIAFLPNYCIYIYIIVTDDHAFSDLLETCPEKCDLLKLMSDIAFKWNIIGECLGIKYVYLASLQSKTSKDIEKLAEVLQLWMDTMPKPVTWNTILQTIESPPIETKFVVIEIEKFLKGESLYSPRKLGYCILVDFVLVSSLLKNQS